MQYTKTKRQDEFLRETEKDNQLQTLINCIQKGWPSVKQSCPSQVHEYWNYRDEMTLIDGLVFKRDRLVVPATLRK